MHKTDIPGVAAIIALSSVALPLLPFALVGIAFLSPFVTASVVIVGPVYVGSKLFGKSKRKKRHEKYYKVEREPHRETGDGLAYRTSYRIMLEEIEKNKDKTAKAPIHQSKLFITDHVEPEKLPLELYQHADEAFVYHKLCLYHYEHAAWKPIFIGFRDSDEIPNRFHIDKLKCTESYKVREKLLSDDDVEFLKQFINVDKQEHDDRLTEMKVKDAIEESAIKTPTFKMAR